MFKAIITALAESGSKKKAPAAASEPNTTVGNEAKSTTYKNTGNKGNSRQNSRQNVAPKMNKTR